MIGDISYTKPFGIDDTTYNYQVKGILYAESERSAQLGLQAYLRLPRDTQFFLLNEVNKGLVILCRDQETISDDSQATGVVSYSRHLKAIVGCGRVFSENATDEAKRDAICLKFGTGERPLEMIASTLVHELDHYFRWVTGKSHRDDLASKHQIDHPTEPLPSYLDYRSVPMTADPTYLTWQTNKFQYVYFDDMFSYIKKNNIQGVLNITDPIAFNLFTMPMCGYFLDEISAGIRNAQIEKKMEVITDHSSYTILSTEKYWLQPNKHIKILSKKLHQDHPMLSLGTIYQIVNCAFSIVRAEISAFYAESVFLFGDEAVKAVAPRLTQCLADITSQRVKLIHYPHPIELIENQESSAAMNPALHQIDGLSVNSSAYLTALGMKSTQRTENDSYQFLLDYLDRQFSLRLSIGGDVAGLVKNTLTLFMPTKENPPVSIPMTQVKGVTPANMGLWKQQKVAPGVMTNQAKAAVKKLPVVVSDDASTIKKPVKVFK